jgi:alpha-L-rhamnosidase
VCCEDAIVDCIDRERGQWDADAFLIGIPVSYTALAGPGNKEGDYCFTDTRLLRNLIRQIGLSQLPDGRLRTCQPMNQIITEIHTILDEYSCLWIQAVRNYYDLTGDDAFLREIWPMLVKAMDYYLNRRTEHGLVWAREFTYPQNPLAYLTCEGTTFNAYFHGSLLDGAHLAGILKEKKQEEIYTQAASDLYTRYNEQLWDASAGTYHGAIMNGKKTPTTGHAAMLALFYDMVPAERKTSVLKYMLDHFDDGFPYTWFYYLDVLCRQNSRDMDIAMLNTIRKKWSEMLTYETETTSEALGGCSYAHEAGTGPTYFLSRYVLGVRNAGTFKDRRILIEPRLGDLKHAEGTTLTDFGPVYVRWLRPNEKTLDFQFDIPRGSVADVALPRLIESPTLVLNGRPLVKDGTPTQNVTLDNRYIRFQAQPGKYEGTISNSK